MYLLLQLVDSSPEEAMIYTTALRLFTLRLATVGSSLLDPLSYFLVRFFRL